MSVQEATPYLILGGKAERAIALYQKALGATVDVVQRFGDMDQSCPEAQKQRIMHAVLRIGSAQLMMSDGPSEAPEGSGKVSIALAWSDPERARRSFDALVATGKVIQPLFDAPWGALFGVLEDEFGIHWMFNCEKRSGSDNATSA